MEARRHQPGFAKAWREILHSIGTASPVHLKQLHARQFQVFRLQFEAAPLDLVLPMMRCRAASVRNFGLSRSKSSGGALCLNLWLKQHTRDTERPNPGARLPHGRGWMCLFGSSWKLSRACSSLTMFAHRAGIRADSANEMPGRSQRSPRADDRRTYD